MENFQLRFDLQSEKNQNTLMILYSLQKGHIEIIQVIMYTFLPVSRNFQQAPIRKACSNFL